MGALDLLINFWQIADIEVRLEWHTICDKCINCVIPNCFFFFFKMQTSQKQQKLSNKKKKNCVKKELKMFVVLCFFWLKRQNVCIVSA